MGFYTLSAQEVMVEEIKEGLQKSEGSYKRVGEILIGAWLYRRDKQVRDWVRFCL